jgi:hypothetical protein
MFSWHYSRPKSRRLARKCLDGKNEDEIGSLIPFGTHSAFFGSLLVDNLHGHEKGTFCKFQSLLRRSSSTFHKSFHVNSLILRICKLCCENRNLTPDEVHSECSSSPFRSRRSSRMKNQTNSRKPTGILNTCTTTMTTMTITSDHHNHIRSDK